MKQDKETMKAVAAVREKIKGKFFSNKVQYSMAETDKDKDRRAKDALKEGETYKDKDGKEWKRENGTLTQTGETRLNLIDPMFCPKCGTIMAGKEKKLNNRCYLLYNHCFSCQLDHEAQLTHKGELQDYIKNIEKENLKAIVREHEQKYKEWKEMQINGLELRDYDDYGKELNRENWEGKSPDDPMFKEIEDSIKEFKEFNDIDD